MKQLVGTDLKLEQYQCQCCKRMFYINPAERSEYDLEFGCPYGCDDAGQYMRTISTNIRDVKDIRGD